MKGSLVLSQSRSDGCQKVEELTGRPLPISPYRSPSEVSPTPQPLATLPPCSELLASSRDPSALPSPSVGLTVCNSVASSRSISEVRGAPAATPSASPSSFFPLTSRGDDQVLGPISQGSLAPSLGALSVASSLASSHGASERSPSGVSYSKQLRQPGSPGGGEPLRLRSEGTSRIASLLAGTTKLAAPDVSCCTSTLSTCLFTLHNESHEDVWSHMSQTKRASRGASRVPGTDEEEVTTINGYSQHAQEAIDPLRFRTIGSGGSSSVETAVETGGRSVGESLEDPSPPSSGVYGRASQAITVCSGRPEDQRGNNSAAFPMCLSRSAGSDGGEETSVTSYRGSTDNNIFPSLCGFSQQQHQSTDIPGHANPSFLHKVQPRGGAEPSHTRPHVGGPRHTPSLFLVPPRPDADGATGVQTHYTQSCDSQQIQQHGNGYVAGLSPQSMHSPSIQARRTNDALALRGFTQHNHLLEPVSLETQTECSAEGCGVSSSPHTLTSMRDSVLSRFARLAPPQHHQPHGEGQLLSPSYGTISRPQDEQQQQQKGCSRHPVANTAKVVGASPEAVGQRGVFDHQLSGPSLNNTPIQPPTPSLPPHTEQTLTHQRKPGRTPLLNTGSHAAIGSSPRDNFCTYASQYSYGQPHLLVDSEALLSEQPYCSPSTQERGRSQSRTTGSYEAPDLRRQLCDQNVFVFHLPAEWSEEDLRREFRFCGSIMSAKVVKRPDGTSKGYGFVCFYEPGAACHAVQAMNGRSVAGKRLKVSLKKTPEECLDLQVQKLIEISESKQPYDRNKDCTLFVFHLPADWDDRSFIQHFMPFGTIISGKIARKDNNASRGYGFITYDTPRSAALAISNMNGLEVGGNKRLKVQLKQQPNPPQPPPCCTIFVFHLPNDWSDQHLRQHFGHYGKLLAATVQRDSKGSSKGYGFVSFDRTQSALNAVIGMNGFSVGKKRLKVSLKRHSDQHLEPFSHYGSNSVFSFGFFPGTEGVMTPGDVTSAGGANPEQLGDVAISVPSALQAVHSDVGSLMQQEQQFFGFPHDKHNVVTAAAIATGVDFQGVVDSYSCFQTSPWMSGNQSSEVPRNDPRSDKSPRLAFHSKRHDFPCGPNSHVPLGVSSSELQWALQGSHNQASKFSGSTPSSGVGAGGTSHRLHREAREGEAPSCAGFNSCPFGFSGLLPAASSESAVSVTPAASGSASGDCSREGSHGALPGGHHSPSGTVRAHPGRCTPHPNLSPPVQQHGQYQWGEGISERMVLGSKAVDMGTDGGPSTRVATTAATAFSPPRALSSTISPSVSSSMSSIPTISVGPTHLSCEAAAIPSCGPGRDHGNFLPCAASSPSSSSSLLGELYAGHTAKGSAVELSPLYHETPAATASTATVGGYLHR